MMMDKVPEDVKEICSKLRANNFEAFLVGGAMRDLLMGEEPHDWDIATNAKPHEVKQIFTHTVDTGIEHGTVTIVLGTSDAPRTYEVTTFRAEGPYSDGRRPDSVSFLASIEPDLARRDFTINAIAGDPLTGKIIDPFNGCNDIKKKIICAVGNPKERFTEDALRVLRAFRFATVLDFDIEKKTIEAIPAFDQAVQKVSIERTWSEITKMLIKASTPSKGFVLMNHTGMLGIFCAPLAKCIGVEQMSEYHLNDVYRHTLMVIDACPKELVIRVAALLHDVGKPVTQKWNNDKSSWSFKNHPEISAQIARSYLISMKVSNDFLEEVVKLVENHDVFYDNSWTDSAIRRLIKKIGVGSMGSLIALRKADIIGRGVDKEITSQKLAEVVELENRMNKIMADKPPLTVNELAINGNDIMEKLALKKGGPIVGKIKNFLMERILDNPALNKKDILLEIIQNSQIRNDGSNGSVRK